MSDFERLGSRWLLQILWVFALGYLLSTVFTLAKFYDRGNNGLFPPLMEYTPTYAASMLLQDMPAHRLYEREPMLEYTKRAVPEMYPEANPIWFDKVRYPPWLYPPHFILLIVPLVLMPYWWSLVAWNIITAIPYLVGIRMILPSRWAWPFALAFPPCLYNYFQGQTGFLTGGFIGLGLALVKRHPILAGISIGLASVKPHFGLLLPVALVAGGHWRVFFSAAVTIAVSALLSIAVLGVSSWQAFFSFAGENLLGFEAGTYVYTQMTTVMSTLALAGVELQYARVFQFFSMLTMLALVAWSWWQGHSRPDTLGLQSAILCIATPLALPMAYIYDLVILAPAVAWLGMDMQQRSAPIAHWVLLILTCLAFLSVITLADMYQLQLGSVLMVILLLLAVYRYHKSLVKF